MEVIDEILAYQTARVVVEFDFLLASERSNVGAPFFQAFHVALICEAHQPDEMVKKHPADACGIHGAEG